jgi:hypothetical protein
MRRKGERGHLPGKSIPSRIRPTRSTEPEEQDSGVYREPVNVDQVMASKFKGADHIEKFPHGYDPFTDGETALRKKVVFRPNKNQLDAIKNRKKTISVNADSKVNGQGPVGHEKQFATKNSQYIEVRTHADSGVVAKANHEKHFTSKNASYVEVNTQAAVDTNIKPNHEQVVLEKKGQVAPVNAGINLNHTEDVEVGQFKTAKSNKLTQTVNNVATNAQYDEYQPLFISKTDLAKAQYRKPNSIREDFNTRAVMLESVIEHQPVGKSTRVKTRQHDVVAEETQANFDGYEVDGDQTGTVEQRPRRQKAESEYAIDNYQDFEEGLEPAVEKPQAPHRRQKADSNLETYQDVGVDVGVDQPKISKGKNHRQQDDVVAETHEVYPEYDDRNPEVVKSSKKSNRQVRFALETHDNFNINVDEGTAKLTATKIRRQKAISEINQDVNYGLQGSVEEDKSSHRSKSSRQQRNLPIEAAEDYQINVEETNSKLGSSKSRRHQAEVADQTAKYALEHVERPELDNQRKPRKQQIEIGIETHDESVVAFERPSIGKSKTRRHINEVGLETHDEFLNNPVQALQDKINLRHRASRQVPQQHLDQAAEVEFDAVVAERESKTTGKSRRHQAQVNGQETYNEEPIMVDRESGQKSKSTKNRRQVEITLDAEVEHNVVNRDYDRPAKSKQHRQKAIIDEEGVPVYETGSIEREKVNRKTVSRQKATTNQESNVEIFYDTDMPYDPQIVQRRRHVTDQPLDSGVVDPHQYVDTLDETPARSKLTRQAQNITQSSGIDYPEEILSGDRNGTVIKPKRRVQFNLDNQQAQANLSGEVDQYPETNNHSKRKNQAPPAEQQAVSKIEIGNHPQERITSTRRRVQSNIEDQTAIGRFEVEPDRQRSVSKNPKGRQQIRVTSQESTIDAPQIKATGLDTEKSRRRQHNLPELSTANVDVECQPSGEDKTESSQHRRQTATNQLSGVQGTEPDLEIDTRDVTRIPNTRPVKQQAQTGVLIAIRNPELDVKTRVQQALERSRRQTATVESHINHPTIDSGEVAIKTEQVVGSSRRQYSAKQDNETANVIVSARRAEANDVNKNSNRRQEQAQADNQVSRVGVDVEMATRLVADKQKVDGRVDEADVNSYSGMLNPIDEDAGIDPVTLDAAGAKKHLAREGSIETTPDTVLYEQGGDRTGLETNTRSRQLIIDPSILARAYGPIRLRRKVK